MTLPGLRPLWQAAWRLQKRFAARAVILMYHSVAETSSDPWGLRVSPEHFAEQLEILRGHAQPLALQQFVEAHHAGHIPDRAVVVTFDDGYADNLYNAKPLLEQYNIPATVFLASGYIGQAHEFWWDELDRLLMCPESLPASLCLKINEEVHQWDLGEASYYHEGERRRDRQQQVWASKPGTRLAFYYTLWQLLRRLSHDQRQIALHEIRRWAGAEPEARSTHRPLTVEEANRLGQDDLVELGAHTITHPFLSAQPLELQRIEIQRSKIQLEEILDRPVLSFSYPHGDYTGETLELVEAAGFTCACSIEAETAWRKSNCWRFPRFEVQNWDGEQFGRRLRQWFQS